MAEGRKIDVVAYMQRHINSSERQSSEQLKQIKEYAETHGMSVVEVFDDTSANNTSAGSMLYSVMRYCRANDNVSAVVAASHTRISRNIKVFKEWEQLFHSIGVELKFTKQAVIGDSEEFLSNILREIADLGSSRRSEYIKRGILKRVRAGYSMQRPPKGYVRTLTAGLYAQDPKVAKHIQCSILHFINDKMSLENLRDAISLVYPQSKTLSMSKLKMIVTNPYYAGYVCYDGEKYKGLHEPLLTESEYKKLLTKINE